MAGAPSLGRLPDSPLPELLHGDGYSCLWFQPLRRKDLSVHQGGE
jgi:hypothetical protein